MPLKLKRKLAIGGAVVAAAGLAGGAYAASSSSTNPRQAFIDDVAKRLNVSPTALNNALKGAYQDQLNQAVKSGKLTQAQANKIKQRIAQAPAGADRLRPSRLLRPPRRDPRAAASTPPRSTSA